MRVRGKGIFYAVLLAGLLSSKICTAQSILNENINRENEPIRPIPLEHDVDPAKVALGDRLFHETLLSGDNSVSCASCHNVSNYGVDGTTTSTGIKDQVGTVNAPTVMNSRFNFAQFWDGRAGDLTEQAKGPVTNPIEMGAVWEEVIAKLSADESYVQAFERLYDGIISEDTIADAIKSYEYTLTTVNSPFDQYLRGYDDAISPQQKRGYSLFKEYGCVACHQGINVGGNMYQRMGAFIPFFNEKNTNSKDDLGRYNVTKDEKDLHVFKVPSLRVAAHTAPYFHDGSVKTLEEAIDIMARYQLGYDIPKQDNKDIQAFIYSLSGQYRMKAK
ncbi:cytochrome-c peroxidase [Terasakiella sp. A23]|uniref:cytochrome-c peroxidase n=1 Tax=Terasakiella sp. FCG-A23 TaxID=3080561 RepID=UPI002954E917|nr:cytochrome-c peroxidase [Terasakiella sp. A23]MDV7338032.1 cytochrome-c peroxidase [Terasakiella sp. A23]